MQLNINGLEINVGEAAIAEAVRRQLLAAEPRGGHSLISLPRIGATHENGIFAGMARGLKGAPDYGLLVGPEATKKLTWKGAHEFAEEHKAAGWRLMLRHEGWLCVANVRDLFKTDDYYWTGEQCEGYGGYAWAQDFGNGYQDGCHEDDDCRVRLVRSIFVIN